MTRPQWLILMVLMSVALACDAGAPAGIPPSIGDETFEITRRVGTDLTDDEFAAFYAPTLEALGRKRADIVVEIGIGTAGTQITAVTVSGSDGTDILEALLPAAFPDLTFTEGVIAGRNLLRATDSRGLPRHIAAFASSRSVFVVDAQSEDALARAITALPAARS